MNTEKSKKYDLRMLLITLASIIASAVIFHFYWNNTKYVIRIILESKITYFLVWVLSIIIFVMHYFKHKSKNLESETIITEKFGDFMDSALGGLAYSTSITTSLTLLKGLYIQKVFDDKKFFLEFDDIDLITVFGVSAFLLYFSVMKVIEIGRETYLVQQTEKVHPDTETTEIE